MAAAARRQVDLDRVLDESQRRGERRRVRSGPRRDGVGVAGVPGLEEPLPERRRRLPSRSRARSLPTASDGKRVQKSRDRIGLRRPVVLLRGVDVRRASRSTARPRSPSGARRAGSDGRRSRPGDQDGDRVRLVEPRQVPEVGVLPVRIGARSGRRRSGAKDGDRAGRELRRELLPVRGEETGRCRRRRRRGESGQKESDREAHRTSPEGWRIVIGEASPAPERRRQLRATAWSAPAWRRTNRLSRTTSATSMS